MYSLKYFLFYEIDVYLYNGATVKLSVSESNPGSLCKTKWQQWCYWCQNRGDKENAWFLYDFTKVIINLQWNPSDDFWGTGRDNYWVFATGVLYYVYVFPRRVLNIRRKIYSIMKGNQSTTTYYWNANTWRKRIWLIMRMESEHEHRRRGIFEGKATRWRRAGLGYNIGHHLVHGSR